MNMSKFYMQTMCDVYLQIDTYAQVYGSLEIRARSSGSTYFLLSGQACDSTQALTGALAAPSVSDASKGSSFGPGLDDGRCHAKRGGRRVIMASSWHQASPPKAEHGS